MPTYQYACTDCTHAFEQVQSFSDDALTECPECSGRLRKLFSAVGVVFKGSGFYRTDSRQDASGSGSGSGSNGSGSKEPAAATSGADTGSQGSGSQGSGSQGSGEKASSTKTAGSSASPGSAA